MAAKTTDLILNAGINKQAQADAARGLQDLINKVAAYRKEAADLASQAKAQPIDLAPQLNATAQAATQASNAAVAGAKKTLDAYQQTADAVRQLREEYSKTAKEEQQAAAASGGGSGGKPALRIEGLRRTGGALSQLGFGEVGGAVSRVGDVAQIATEFGTLTAALGPLALVIGGVVAGFALLDLGLKAFDGRIDEGKRALAQAIEQQKAYYEAIENGTRKEIEAKLKAAQAQLRIDEETLAADKKLRDDAFQEAVQRLGSDAAARVEISFREGRGEFKALDDEIKRLTDTLDADKGAVAGLKKAYDDNAVASRSVIADAEKAATDRLEIEKKRVQGLRELDTLIAGGTPAIYARIGALAQERDAIDTSIKNLSDAITLAKGVPDSNEQVKELKKQSDELTRTIQALQRSTLPAIQQLDALKQQIASIGKLAELYAQRQALFDEAEKVAKDRAFQAQKDALEKDYSARIDAAKAVEKAADDQKRLTAIIEDEQQKERDLRKSFLKQNAEDLDRYNASVEKLTSSFNDTRLQNQEKFQKQEQIADERYAKERQRTLRDLNETLLDLARQGDVAGFIAAQRQGVRTLRDLDERNQDEKDQRKQAYDEQQKDAQKNYDKQLADLQLSFAQQQREHEQAYREQLNTLRENARQRLAEERKAQEAGIKQSVQLEEEYREKLKALQDARNKELKDAEDMALQVRLTKLQTALSEQQTLYDTFWSKVQAAGKGVVDTLLGKLGLQVTPFGGSFLNNLFGGVKLFANGGAFGANQPMIVGERGPELLSFNRPGYVMSSVPSGGNGGRSVHIGTINIGAGNAITRQEVKQAFIDYDRQLQAAFEAGSAL